MTELDAAKAAALLVDNGLLWDINRRILHPLGLALAVDMDGEDFLKFSLLETRDPEGLAFDAEAMADGIQKHRAYMRHIGNARVIKRRAALGYAIQGTGPKPLKG